VGLRHTYGQAMVSSSSPTPFRNGCEDRCEDALHHAGQPLGEWLLRELQRLDARRVLERGDLLYLGRSSDPDRSLAKALQHHQAAQLVGVSSTGPGTASGAMTALRFRFAPPAVSHGAGGGSALTISTDRSAGAGYSLQTTQRYIEGDVEAMRRVVDIV
jgi:hypothetical protein